MGSILGCVIPKTLRMVPVATLLDAQHYKASTGFSCLKNISSLTYVTKNQKVGKKITKTPGGPYGRLAIVLKLLSF